MDDINFESELDQILDTDITPQEIALDDIPELSLSQGETQKEACAPQDTPTEEPRTAEAPKRERRSFKKGLFQHSTANERTDIAAEKPSVAEQKPSGTFLREPARPQRRPRMSKQDMFKQNTLPAIILGISALLILIFIIGSITRSIQKHQVEKEASIAVSESVAAEQARLEAEMNSILDKAENMAAGYDFDGAIKLIDSFSGNIGGYPKLQDARARYEYSKEALVPWEDPNSIVNLSFQMLIADSSRAFSHSEYGSSMHNNFITVNEFRTILERLYENGYVLVNVHDLVEVNSSNSGSSYFTYKELLLPEGKKPLVLTQTNVNYNLYLVDSDEDMIADKNGVGFASKLVLDSDGSVVCEIVNSDGTVSTGDYDLIPILDAFVEEHPDFSYHGAKAVLALTGYNGLFGYRTNSEGRALFGEEQYEKDVAAVKAIAETLTNSGYELACYTYGNNPYGTYSLSQIQAEMNVWADEVTPILGDLDIMVFAQNSDINSGVLYSGDKFEYLKTLGYQHFIGFCTEGDPFTYIAEDYVRQGRLLVTGYNLKNNAAWFAPIMDTTGLLDEARDNEG